VKKRVKIKIQEAKERLVEIRAGMGKVSK